MTKAELVEEVSRVSDLTKKHSEVIVDTVFQSIIDALHRGEKIELRGFGSFRLRKREPRKGRNPEDRRQGGRPAEARPLFQAGQGTERSDQQRRRGRCSTAGLAVIRLGTVVVSVQTNRQFPVSSYQFKGRLPEVALSGLPFELATDNWKLIRFLTEWTASGLPGETAT